MWLVHTMRTHTVDDWAIGHHYTQGMTNINKLSRPLWPFATNAVVATAVVLTVLGLGPGAVLLRQILLTTSALGEHMKLV
jgi:hypothetical protein